jgi:hypothetical protein
MERKMDMLPRCGCVHVYSLGIELKNRLVWYLEFLMYSLCICSEMIPTLYYFWTVHVGNVFYEIPRKILFSSDKNLISYISAIKFL